MSEATKRHEQPPTEHMLEAFAQRVMNEESTADLFGVDDHFVDEVINRAYKLYVAKCFDQAEVLLLGATALDENRAYAHLLLGDILLQRARFDEAVDVLERAHKLAGDSLETLAKLGEAQIRSGRHEAALGNLHAAMEQLSQTSPHRKRCAALLEVATRNSGEQRLGEDRP